MLFVMSGLRQGGQERQLVVLLPALRELGHQVTVAVPYSGDYYQDVLRRLGIETHVLFDSERPQPHQKLKRSVMAPMRVAKLRALVRSAQYDVVHGVGASNIYASATKPFNRVKVVWGIRDTPAVNSGVKNRVRRGIGQGTDLIIANSEAGKRACIASGLPADRIKVVQNGIDTARFRIDLSWRKSVRRELGLDDDQPLIGIVGRIHPVKDHETFIRAAQRVAASEPRARFIVVGPTDEFDAQNLQALANELGLGSRIFWLGARDDVERWLNAMDVNVLSSTCEGFPNVLAEAMACGVPCVTTDVGDAAIIVGSMGKVVPIGDPQAMARGIQDLLLCRGSMDRNALRSAIVDRWSVEALATRTEQLLTSLGRS